MSGIGGGHGVGGDEVVAYEASKRRLGNAARGYVGEGTASGIVEDLLRRRRLYEDGKRDFDGIIVNS